MKEKQIMQELKQIKEELSNIKENMADINSVMTEDDYKALVEYRKEKAIGKLISHKELIKSWA